MQIVQKLKSYCNFLRDDGVAAIDYLSQISLLLFLKMANERGSGTNTSALPLVSGQWPKLLSQDEGQLLSCYTQIIEELSDQPGVVGAIFRHSQLKVRRPSILKRLICEIDAIRWLDIEQDVLAEAYEGILAKTAEDVKSGAGQYFTPRPLIQAIVDVMRPEPGERICDPACGTGGFLIDARNYLFNHYQLSSQQRWELQHTTFSGGEIVEETARLCLMNLLLHGVGSEDSDACPIWVGDSLRSAPSEHVDVIFCNPPFGQESGGVAVAQLKRRDFCCETGSKQLNFVQHIVCSLKRHGRAAIVVPDNVLFAGGAGETIRRWLLRACNVHTLLRLPTGIFYAPGVKASVLFFQKGPARFEPWTTRLWVYDFRSDVHYTLRNHSLSKDGLQDFVQSYRADDMSKRKESDRFRPYSYEELLRREKCSLDIFKPRPAAKKKEEQSSGAMLQTSAGKGETTTPQFDPASAEEVLENLRRMLPKGSRIYISIASETPLLVKFYAACGGSIKSLDFMLSRCIPTFRLVRRKLTSGMFASDKGILHDDPDTVLFMIDEIGRRVWKDSNAYYQDWLPE